jgi:hypothetical protein
VTGKVTPTSHFGGNGVRTFPSKAGVSLRRQQSGQSMVEYAVIGAVLVSALLLPLPGSQETVSQLLCDAIRNFYSSLSMFLSLP